MNATAKTLGLTEMHFGGPAGLSSQDRSSANNMTRLALAAMALPQFRSPVGTQYITLPIAGPVPNVDKLLFKDADATGIKTGWTPEAGPSIVFSASRMIDGQRVTVTGTIFHDQSWTGLYIDAQSLIAAAFGAAAQTLGAISRGAFVAALAQTLGPSGVPSATTFYDVPPNDPHLLLIQAAYQAGWVKGVSPTSFDASGNVTRAQVAELEVRALGKAAEAGQMAADAPPFKDAAQIPAWARGYVVEAAHLGLLHGFPDGTFRPNMPLTPKMSDAVMTSFQLALANHPLAGAASVSHFE